MDKKQALIQTNIFVQFKSLSSVHGEHLQEVTVLGVYYLSPIIIAQKNVDHPI